MRCAFSTIGEPFVLSLNTYTLYIYIYIYTYLYITHIPKTFYLHTVREVHTTDIWGMVVLMVNGN